MNKRTYIVADIRYTEKGIVPVLKNMEAVGEKAKYASQQAQKAASGVQKGMQKAGQASLQLQDIAVQAQAGTNAATIAAQQLPQLLSAFGPKGMIVGAAVAGIALVGKAIWDNVVGPAEKAADAALEAAKRATDGMVEMVGRQQEEIAKKQEASYKITELLGTAEKGLIDATEERAGIHQKILGFQDEEYQNALNYLQSQGVIKNAEEVIAGVKKAAAEREKQHEIDMQNLRIERVKKEMELTRTMQAEVERDRQGAERQWGQASSKRVDAESRMSRFKKLGLEDSQQFRSAETAAALAKAEQEKAQAREIALTDKLTDLGLRLKEQNLELGITTDSVAENVKLLNEQAASKERLNEINEATDAGVKTAEQIKAALENFTPINAAQQQRVAELKEAVADGQIQANETAKVGTALSVLNSTLQAGQEITHANIQELIRLNNTFKAEMMQANAAIKEIAKKTGTNIGTYPIR